MQFHRMSGPSREGANRSPQTTAQDSRDAPEIDPLWTFLDLNKYQMRPQSVIGVMPTTL
jgi:hypothetical protein